VLPSRKKKSRNIVRSVKLQYTGKAVPSLCRHCAATAKENHQKAIRHPRTLSNSSVLCFSEGFEHSSLLP
jgi:hypothetical protein